MQKTWRKSWLWLGVLVALSVAALVLYALSRPQGEPLPPEAAADRIVVHKALRTLTLFRDGQPLKTYTVALGGSPTGPKRAQGDQKTPEGEYLISRKHASDRFHRSLHVSYPSAKDLAFARAHGIADPGGDIKIHGLPEDAAWLGSLHTRWDWTAGCLAVTNPEIDELWRAVPEGTPILILP